MSLCMSDARSARFLLRRRFVLAFPLLSILLLLFLFGRLRFRPVVSWPGFRRSGALRRPLRGLLGTRLRTLVTLLLLLLRRLLGARLRTLVTLLLLLLRRLLGTRLRTLVTLLLLLLRRRLVASRPVSGTIWLRTWRLRAIACWNGVSPLVL